MRRRGHERRRETGNERKRDGKKRDADERTNGEKGDAMSVSSCGRRCHPAESGDA